MDSITNSHSTPSHVALVCSPGMGHLIPVVELGQRLATRHNFKVTIFVVPSHVSEAQAPVLKSAMRSTKPNLLDIVQLPPVDISSKVGPNTPFVTQLCIIMRQTRPALRSAISTMNHRPTTLIVDLFGTESLPIADEFNMLKYVFIASNAWFLALTVYVPILDKHVEGEYVDQKEPLKIPGCAPVRPEDVVDPMLDRKDQQYEEYVRMGMEITKVDGILVNTWEELQPRELKAMGNWEYLGTVVKVPVYPVGPVVRSVEKLRDPKGGLMEWLDKQPNKSVIYVSFGSGGTLSFEQTREVALGLELSRQRFIWVVRRPSGGSPDSAFFDNAHGGGEDDDSEKEYLPQGFRCRTHDRGLVVDTWVPQVDILGYPSIGGFLSHCGWNSALESITNDVPMVVWPLYAEQRLNATLLAEEIGVAVRPKVLPTKKVVGREEIEKMVRKIMEREREGEENSTRVKARELRHSAEKALSEGGSSFNALNGVANLIKQG